VTGPRCRLYLITPPALDPATFAPVLAEALAGGDVACVQLRLKDVPDEAVLAAGRLLMPIVQAAGAAFIVNDRPDLARALGADGVHVGQDDASYGEARKLLGPDAIVGVTCHDSRHLAMEAAEAGADYVAFGAIYPTATKEAKTSAPLDLIGWWAELFETPCVAIGGITVENAAPVIAAGADFLAVSAGVWAHKDGPRAAVARFNALLGA
jgi:thiamine-phosphate pyrophosphorylase